MRMFGLLFSLESNSIIIIFILFSVALNGRIITATIYIYIGWNGAGNEVLV